MSTLGRVLGFAATLIIVSACGGGGGSGGGGGGDGGLAPTPTPTPTVSAGGVWRGYARLGIDWYDFTGLVSESGRAYFTTDGGSWLVSVQITSDGNIITGGPIAPANSVVSVLYGDRDFYYAGTPPLSGTLQSRSTLDAKAIFPSGDTLLIEVSYQKDEYEQGSSLGSVAGSYGGGWDLFDEGIVLTISDSGTLRAQAPSSGCDVNGRVSILNRTYNLYSIQYSVSGCTDPEYLPLNGVEFTGLASLLPHQYDRLDPFPYLEIVTTATVNGTAAGDYVSFRRNSSASAGGIWRGSITFGTDAPLALDGVITDDGQIRLRDSSGRQIFDRYPFSRTSVYEDDVRGSLSWSLPIFGGGATAAGSVQGSVTMLATLTERAQLSGSLEFRGNEGDIEFANFTLEYDPVYEKSSSLGLLAGTYLNTGHAMVIDSAGSVLFTSTVTNCVHQGVAQRADQYNAYQLDLLASSCTGNYEFLNGTISTGLAFLVDGLVPADTLVFRSHATLSNGRYVVGNWGLSR